MEAKEVLKAMCNCIFASTEYGDASVRHCICSIILQRVVGITNLSRDDQLITACYCEEMLLKADQDTKVKHPVKA